MPATGILAIRKRFSLLLKVRTEKRGYCAHRKVKQIYTFSDYELRETE